MHCFRKKYRKISLKKDIDVVYNDEYVLSGIEEILSGRLYSLQLIERNGEYECVIIKNYENYIVGGFDSVENIIYDKVSSEKLELNLIDKLIIKNTEGKELSFDDIKTDSVLTVYKSQNGERAEIIVSENKVTGVVTSVKSDDFGRQCFDLTDKIYQKAHPDSFDAVTAGNGVVLYLDAYGYVAYVESDTNSDILAYLIKPYYDESEEKIYLKLYDRSGKILKLECDTKLKINKEKINKNKSEVYSRLENYGQGLITYKKNTDGLICNITLASNDKTSNLRLRFPKETQRYRSTGNRLGQKMCLDNNTIIFGIPTDVKNATEDDFIITTKASLYGDMNYIVESYAYSEKVGYEQILLIYENDWNYKHGNTIGILVTGTSTRINDDGDVVDCIIGWQGSQKVEKPCHASFSVADAKIEKGDYIIFNENKKGEIVFVNVSYDLSEGRRPKAKDMHVLEALSSGYVHEVNGNVATVGIESGADFDMAYDFVAGTVLIYDKKYNSVTTGTVNDLISYDVAGSNCDFLLTHMRYSKQLVYIIYR